MLVVLDVVVGSLGGLVVLGGLNVSFFGIRSILLAPQGWVVLKGVLCEWFLDFRGV